MLMQEFMSKREYKIIMDLIHGVTRIKPRGSNAIEPERLDDTYPSKIRTRIIDASPLTFARR